MRWSRTTLRVLTPLSVDSPVTGPVTVTIGGQTIAGPPFTVSDAAPPLTPEPSPPPYTPVPLLPSLPPLPLFPGPPTQGSAPLTGDWPVFQHDPRQLGLADGALDPRQLSPWSCSLGSQPGCAPVVLGGIA